MSAKSKGSKSPELRAQMGCLNINGKTHPLYEGVNTIGRHKDATVIIRDSSVSQHHALITIVNDNQHFVSDLRSFNGTIVEHNKLNPLLLYELPLETVINFAKCRAVYKKVPSNSQSIINRGYSGCNTETTQTTQDLNESFYAAQTQAFENVQGPTCNYFEDDYNFADIPSPPMQQTKQENKTILANEVDKSGLSIHEMPTQIYCSDMINDVVIGESQAPDASNMRHQIITTKVDVHDLPTQIICAEVAVNKSVGETQSEISLRGPSLHDMPTQIYVKTSEPKETNAPHDRRDTVDDKRTKPIIKITECKSVCNDSLDDIIQCGSKSNNSNTEKKSTADVSSDLIEETLLEDSGLDTTVESSKSNKSGRSSMPVMLEDKAVSSLDSDPQSPLHVSQLHCRTIKPVADGAEVDDLVSSGSEIIKDKLKKKSKPVPESEEFEDSSSEEISNKKKKCRVLDSDNSETDIEDLQDIIEPHTSKLANKSSSVSLNEISETKNKSAHKKSEGKKITSKGDTSGSDTEIEEFEIQDKTATTFKNNAKMKTLIITEGRNDINNYKIKNRNETEASSNNEKVHIDNSGSDTDGDDLEFDTKNKMIQEKQAESLNNSSKLDETDVIPNTQVSEDDDDDFNFMPESNSTLVTKRNSDVTKEHIFDVSQKLKELCKASMVPQNYSEESFHLGLSEGSEHAKHTEEQVADNKNEDDDDKTPDISDIDEPIAESEDIFNKPTQKITADKKINTENTPDVFAMDTQNLTDVVIEKEKNDEIFAKPCTSKFFNNKKQSESQSACVKNSYDLEDDLFMQPTQPLVDLFQTKGIGTSSSTTNNEDIFMQPTQVYAIDNQNFQSKPIYTDAIEDDIFMQPTQQVVTNDALVNELPPLSHHKPPVLPDKTRPINDIFIQPTQLFETESAIATKNNSTESIFSQPTQLIEVVEPKTDNNKPSDNDIFMQPTQPVISNDALASEPPPLFHHKPSVMSATKPEEDIFMQPTQILPIESTGVTKHPPNESIFLESTQLVEVSEPKAVNVKLDSNDIFMQATQQIVFPCDEPPPFPDCNLNKLKKKSLSLHKDSPKRNKFEEVESQLEVMFASQTLRISSQTNSRPSNPLANVLEGKQIANSEQNSEEPETEANDTSKNEDENVKSLSDSDDLKEYCAMPTLPIDEIADFQSSSHQAEQKSNIITENCAQLLNRTTPIVSGTPRKRGRPTKVGKKTTLEVTYITDTTRKSRRIRKVSDDEQAVEPLPSTSMSGIAEQAEDENLLKNKDSKDVNKEDVERSDSFTAEDDELETPKKNSMKQAETNLKQKLQSGRITTRNNADEGNAVNIKADTDRNTDRKKNMRDEDGVDTKRNKGKDASKATILTPGVKDTDIQNSFTDEDDELETSKRNNKKQVETNLKQKPQSSRIRRRNNADEGNATNIKDTNTKKNIHDKDGVNTQKNNRKDASKSTNLTSGVEDTDMQNSETDEEDDELETPKKNSKKQVENNLKPKLQSSRITRRNNADEGNATNIKDTNRKKNIHDEDGVNTRKNNRKDASKSTILTSGVEDADIENSETDEEDDELETPKKNSKKQVETNLKRKLQSSRITRRNNADEGNATNIKDTDRKKNVHDEDGVNTRKNNRKDASKFTILTSGVEDADIENSETDEEDDELETPKKNSKKQVETNLKRKLQSSRITRRNNADEGNATNIKDTDRKKNVHDEDGVNTRKNNRTDASKSTILTSGVEDADIENSETDEEDDELETPKKNSKKQVETNLKRKLQSSRITRRNNADEGNATNIKDTDRKKNVHDEDGVNTRKNNRKDASKFTILTSGVEDADIENSETDEEDDELETPKKNSKKQVENNLKPKLQSSRITRRNNADEGNATNIKDTNRKKNIHDEDGVNTRKNNRKDASKSTILTSGVEDADIENSETDEEDDELETPKKNSKKQVETNLKRKLQSSRITRRNNADEGNATNIKDTDRKKNVHDEDGVNTRKNNRTDASKSTILTSGVEDADIENSETDEEDDELETPKKNSKKQVETNLKRKLQSSRITRRNNADEGNATNIKDTDRKKNVHDEDGVNTRKNNRKDASKFTILTSGVEDADIENSETDEEDDELETPKKNSKKQVETNLKRKLQSSRITRRNNADEGNATNIKNTNRKKNMHDEDGANTQKYKRKDGKSTILTPGLEDTDSRNSETVEEDDEQEISKKRTRAETKTTIKEPLTMSKRVRRNNVSKIAEENSDNQTNKRVVKGRKQDVPSSTSNETILILSDNSDSNLEKSNVTKRTTGRCRKVNDKMQVKEVNTYCKTLQEEPSSWTLNEKSKKRSPAARHMETKSITTNSEISEEESLSTNPKPSSADASCAVVGGKRTRRLLDRDIYTEIGKAKPPLKKMKNNESVESEEVKSNSDTSEMDFCSSRKNTAHLNVTCSTPDRNRRMQKPKVVFTMLNSPELESLVRRLGGMVVDTVSACTVLVTGSLKRSQKLLSAVGEGKPICSPKWLQECKKANKFLDPWDYILEDEEAESKWNFTLKESLNRSQNKKLLQEFTVVLVVSEAVDVLKAAIESCGGKCFMKVPSKNVGNNLVVVANPSKKATYSRFLKQQPSATVVAPEAIFDGVLRQELHWEDHMLS